MTTFERIKKLTQNRGLSLKELSEKLDFGESTIYKWKSQTPKTEYLEKIADFFDVSVDYLLGREESHEKTSMTKQVMMRMDTGGLSDQQVREIEDEMERFFSWRIDEIKRESKD